ncbi:MAG TPA: hypothetical protein PLP05_12665 [Sedimentisphaerales bacterium]|nr:hypothetical protein [Sedimentisphaerales bacterium]
MKAFLTMIFGAVLMLSAAWFCGCSCQTDSQIGQQPAIGAVDASAGGQAIVTQATGSAWPLVIAIIVVAAVVLIIGLVFLKVFMGYRRFRIDVQRQLWG